MIFFALIKLIPITLTLPGIAGLILTIGVAADSNIVIFERIKEEVRAGRSMSSAIAAGYKRGIATIIDANVVTLLTAFILFVLATSDVKGFAFTLGVGTIVSLLTAVVFTQALLGSMSRTRLLRSPAALGASGESRRWHLDFMGASRWFFTISGLILLVGALSLATKQLNFGIDFESGTRLTAALEKPTDEEGVRGALDSIGISGEEIQQVSDPVLGDNVFQVQSSELAAGRSQGAPERRSRSEFGIVPNGFESTSVGPTFGQQVANSALKALIFSLLVICGYVALRFDPKFAVPVLIAIFHDILITAGDLLVDGERGEQRDRRRLPHHLGLLALRHDHRLRPNTRERAADAAGGVLPDRQPLDERGPDAVAGDQLLDPARGRLAARLRRRDPAGLRLRDADRDRLRYLLVDLHRLAGADGLEGTRARLRATAACASPRSGEAFPPSPTTSSSPSSAATTRAKRSTAVEPVAEAPAGQAAPGAVATVERSGDGNGADPATNGEADPASAERRERNAERRARRQQRRKHGRKR